ncbi:thioredoxin [Paenibacillus hodogayensis]|uniref:Thioredoxin n=1 Tax=Paenibacillus hodogayensis TaxID=279208 RepID=A0ABV5VXJ1_9BACL
MAARIARNQAEAASGNRLFVKMSRGILLKGMMKMAIQHANDATFHTLVQKEGITVVNFWAPWCGPCRTFAPVLEQFEKEANGSLAVVKVNVDENPVTSSQFQIMSIPATIIFKDGKPLYNEVGLLPLGVLQQLVASH